MGKELNMHYPVGEIHLIGSISPALEAIERSIAGFLSQEKWHNLVGLTTDDHSDFECVGEEVYKLKLVAGPEQSNDSKELMLTQRTSMDELIQRIKHWLLEIEN